MLNQFPSRIRIFLSSNRFELRVTLAKFTDKYIYISLIISRSSQFKRTDGKWMLLEISISRRLFITRIPKMCEIPQLASDSLKPRLIVKHLGGATHNVSTVTGKVHVG